MMKLELFKAKTEQQGLVVYAMVGTQFENSDISEAISDIQRQLCRTLRNRYMRHSEASNSLFFLY